MLSAAILSFIAALVCLHFGQVPRLWYLRLWCIALARFFVALSFVLGGLWAWLV